MSGSQSDSLEGRRQQGSYLGSYHRIRWADSKLQPGAHLVSCRHLSELSETGGAGGYPGHYRPPDTYSGGSYGSPEQGYDTRDGRYASMASMARMSSLAAPGANTTRYQPEIFYF